MSESQPEFWLTVKENGEYPPRVERAATMGLDTSPYNSTMLAQSFETDRTCRFYCRKIANVQYTDSPGLQSLTYDLTGIYGHVFMLDILDQPPEGTVLLCVHINGQIFAFGSDTRHSGGTP